VNLEGIRVLDLADERGLVAGRLLADLGAEVVRVDGLSQGDPLDVSDDCEPNSMEWRVFGANRSRISHRPSEAERKELLSSFDAVILTGSPSELSARDLEPEALLAQFPRLIVACISPFGMLGARADWPATDLIVWASGGPLEPHRSQEGVPLRPSIPQAFLHAGADAAVGVLLAYLARQSSGRGQVVDVSAQSSLSTATLGRVLADVAGDPNARRQQRQLVGLDRSGSGAATSGDFKKWKALDGLVELHLAMGPASGRFTNNFIRWMVDEGAYPKNLPQWDWVKVPELIELGEFTDAHLEAVRATTRDFLASKTREQVRQAALERRLLCVGISEIEDVARDTHFQARHLVNVCGEPKTAIVEKWFHGTSGCSPTVRQGYPQLDGFDEDRDVTHGSSL